MAIKHVCFITLASLLILACPSGGEGGSDAGSYDFGEVTIENTCGDVSGTRRCSTSGAPRFFSLPGGLAAHGCTESTTGNCTVTQCSNASDDFLSSPGSFAVNAGTVKVEGTNVVEGVKSEWSSGGYGAFYSATQPWNGGETLIVSAAGDIVSAFYGKTVTAPNEIVVTAPECKVGDCGPVSAASGLTVSWTGGAATSAQVKIGDNSGLVFIVCPFTSSPARVPSAVLSAIDRRPGNDKPSIKIAASNSTSFSAGTFSATFTASNSPVVSGTFTLTP